MGIHQVVRTLWIRTHRAALCDLGEFRGCGLRVLPGSALLGIRAGRIMTGLFVEVCTGLWDPPRMSGTQAGWWPATAGGCSSLGLSHARSCGWSCGRREGVSTLPLALSLNPVRNRGKGSEGGGGVGVLAISLWMQRKEQMENNGHMYRGKYMHVFKNQTWLPFCRSNLRGSVCLAGLTL